MKQSVAQAMKMDYKTNNDIDSDDSGTDSDLSDEEKEAKEAKKTTKKPQKKRGGKRRASLVERQSQINK